MKKSLQATKILGVTLLEIMLVLAIASMVIVMSIRYYQSASNNQKINSALNVITSVVAAGESFLGSKGAFTGMTTADLTPYLPNNVMPTSPWGGDVVLSGTPTATTYAFDVNVPTAVCGSLKAPLETQSAKFTAVCGTNKITVTVKA